ncbi:MAG: DUF423 domain-containing protein [Planctomycetaceae bacterium]|nr:DUF423 domain-containing protein [Planctomycetaceae bacterium]
MSGRFCLFLAAVLGFIGVGLGAFGAHGLNDTKYLEKKYADMEPKNVAGQMIPASVKYYHDFRTGVEYHMTHTLALLASGVVLLRFRSRLISAAAWCFVGGIVLFSGALYVLVIMGPKWLGIPWGMVAPIGGTLQMIGWVLLACGGLMLRNPAE